MKDELLAFIQTPSQQTLTPLREKLVESADYDPYANRLKNIDELIEMGDLGQARELIVSAMPYYVLSPRIHLIAAYLLSEVDEATQASKTEEQIATVCIEGILSTGNGSREKPYLVTFLSDEYDVLDHLQKELTRQSLRHDGHRHFDVMTTSDNDEIWFDITDLYNHLSQTQDD